MADSVGKISDSGGLLAAAGRYVQLLKRLYEKELLGKLALYPAIGVDVLPALFVDLLGLNWWPHEEREILELIRPILAPGVLRDLEGVLPRRLTYLSRLDVGRAGLLESTLEPYQSVSRKSLLLKGLFENAFLREWDTDRERFYPTPPPAAKIDAEAWLVRMVRWLREGDTVVAFDRALMAPLASLEALQEVPLLSEDPCENEETLYSEGVLVLSLPCFARVFRRV